MKRIAQWGIFSTLFIVGFIAFIILCAEDTPEQPMSYIFFFGSKITAFAVIYLCIYVGKILYQHGLLPEMENPEENEEED